MSKKAKKDERVYKCQHCGQKCSSKAGLTNHINAKHDGQESKIGAKGEGNRPLKPQQETFCQLYASDKEFLGNGVQSYIEAYNVKVGKCKDCQSYEYCRYRASRLLTNNNILKRINEIYEAGGLNDAHVDKQLEFLITQNAEFNPKIRAIQEYNKMKGRTKDRMEHVHAFSDISKMSDEELEEEQKRLSAFFNKE